MAIWPSKSSGLTCVLGTLAQHTASVVEQLRGAQDVITQTTEGVDYLQVVIDPIAAGRNGLAVADVQNNLRAQIDGMPAGMVLESNRRTPILVRGGEDIRMSALRFNGMRMALPGGGGSPLAAIATLKAGNGPVKWGANKVHGLPLVQSNVDGRDLVGFVDDAKAAVAKRCHCRPGITWNGAGSFENQQRAAARLGLVIPLALGAIFFGVVHDLWVIAAGGLDLVQHPVCLGRRHFGAVGNPGNICRYRRRWASLPCWVSTVLNGWW